MIVACDAGFGYAKGANDNKIVCFPNLITQISEGKFTSNNDNLVIKYQNKYYQIGIGDERMPIRYRVLDERFYVELAAIIGQLVPQDDSQEIDLILGLPFEDYCYRAKEYREAIIAKNPLSFEFNNRKKVINLDNLYIHCQSFGSLVDLLNPSDDLVGIIDVGFFNINCICYRNLNRTRILDSGVNFTCPGFGLVNLIRDIQEHISRHDPDIRITEIEIENMLISNRFKVCCEGDRIDITNIVDSVLDMYTTDVVNKILSQWSWVVDNLSCIIFTGGGAISILKRYIITKISKYYYGKIHIPHDAQYANVRGLLKLAKSSMVKL